MDFIADCLFVAKLFAIGDDLKYTAIAFVAIPVLVNAGLVFFIMNREFHDSAKMRVWFDDNAAITACVLLLSLSNIDVMFILFSRSFGGAEPFMMPISKLSQSAVHYYGIPQHVLEDIPQLVLQLYVIDAVEEMPVEIVYLSLATSVLALLIGLMRRCLYWTSTRHERRLQSYSSNQAISREMEMISEKVKPEEEVTRGDEPSDEYKHDPSPPP